MSLYRTLSQLPNDLPLTLGEKVDPNAAKPPQSDPLDAWFTAASLAIVDGTPIVRDVKAKAPKKRVIVQNVSFQKEMDRAVEAIKKEKANPRTGEGDDGDR